MDDADDAQLLRRLSAGDRDAFAAIVRRHIDFVYATARRRVNGDTHLAEDVAQAVFLILSQKAASIDGRTVLVGWLYRTVGHVASNAMRMQRRREHYERNAAAERTEHAMPGDEVADEETLARLDAALNTLRAPSRDAILLRFFRRLTFAEVGRALGIGDEAAKKRVARAVDELRGALAAGGTSAATIAVTLAALDAGATSAAAAPAALAGTILTTHAPSAAAAALSKGTMIAMSTKKIAAGVAAAVALIGGGIGAVAVLAPPSRAGSTSATVPAATVVDVAATVAPGGAVDSDGALVALMPEGSITLLAVAGAMWSPDGQESLPRPFARFPGGIGLKPEETARVFLVRHDFLKETAPMSLRPRVEGQKSAVTAALNPDAPPEERLWGTLGIVDPARPTSFFIHLASGPYETVATGVPGTANVTMDDGRSVLEPLVATPGDATPQLEVRMQLVEFNDQRLVVVDRAGREYTAIASRIGGRGRDAATGVQTYDAAYVIRGVRPADVAGVRIERRGFDRIVEFRDVATAPGQPASPGVRVTETKAAAAN